MLFRSNALGSSSRFEGQLGLLTLLLFFFYFIYLFIYFWLCWVFLSVRGLSLVAASGGYSSSRCAGLSLSRPLLLRRTGSRRAGSAIVAHGPSRSAACGILPDQGSNPRPLHWQADSQPLRHQGSPHSCTFPAGWSSKRQLGRMGWPDVPGLAQRGLHAEVPRSWPHWPPVAPSSLAWSL